ncbi:MAG: TIGR03560 family F420-dependent LLM class oxidoreductase [Actinobacteria bacterium]|nr:TIGR03560 family F420-dependent LLM class oxidoreductase [Actinomycetota bacterium]
MRFGAFVPQGWRMDLVGIPVERHWETMRAVAEAAEGLGYESVWVYDHFHTVPVPSREATHEAWALMAALAASTRTVRLGQMCTCVAYRPPAYLAKVAATIDVVSGGRLEMGIGAGWYEHEYAGYGYEFLPAAGRIGQLREAVEVMRRLWTEDEVHYEGRHYRLSGAICRPRPLQIPHIPIWVAGGGEQLTLGVAARYASYTNFGGSPEEFARKSQALAGHCRAVGTDFDAIVRSTNLFVICRETEVEVAAVLAGIENRYRRVVPDDKAERAAAAYRAMAGTPEQLAERLRPWAAAGLGYAIIYFPQAAYDATDLELFAREVMPAFR